MKTSFVLFSLAAAINAQRPKDQSICDYYTTALLKENNATNQETLLTLVVNTAVIGNYTQPNVGIAVPGILAPGEYKGAKVNLLPYFSGMLDSTNSGGNMGISVNFLDGGGAAPLMMDMPANNTNSAQYKLLTHLYQYFAGLLGCSQYGNTTSPYSGGTSMYQVHKFMAISEAEFGYFVTQVGLSAASFGAAKSDVDAVGMALMQAFGMRCAPPAAIPATASPAPQAICIESDCPVATSSDCSIYSPVIEPKTASPSASASATASATASTAASVSQPATTAPSVSQPATTAPPMSQPATSASTQPSATPAPYNGADTLIPTLSGVGAALFGLVAFAL